MDTVIKIDMLYDFSEVEAIIKTMTPDTTWSTPSMKQMLILLQKYFTDNRKNIYLEIDKLICNTIAKILIENEFIQEGVESDEW